MDTYSDWKDVPANLKTKTALKAMGLKLKRGQLPVAVKTHWDYKIPDYNLYDVSEAVPNVVSEAQRAAIEKAKAASLAKRTCTKCGWVEDLSRNYRNKMYISGGLCPYCREEADRAFDRNEASEWAQTILGRSDVLILDTETTDLDGEIIELAIINLKGETVFNHRFKPVTPVSAGAQAVHGISTDMLANEPRFIEHESSISSLLECAKLVLIYNAAFDVPRLHQTYHMHERELPKFKTDCIMEQYAAFCGEWSDYHGNYKYQPLGGGHSAESDCKAALATLHEMAEAINERDAKAKGQGV